MGVSFQIINSDYPKTFEVLKCLLLYLDTGDWQFDFKNDSNKYVLQKFANLTIIPNEEGNFVQLFN